MKLFLIALQFLTILPIKISASAQGRCASGARGGSAFGGKSEINEKDFGRSLLYFPLVGLLIGVFLSANTLLFSFLPNFVRGAFILIISIIITGGIHLDGFADTCDGFYGNRPKEKILEIMKDSHIGTMGVIGVVSLLLLKFSLIVSFPEGFLWKALIMMSVFSRWSQALACSISNYARKEGKAKFFIEYARPRDVIMGALLTFVLFLLMAKLKGMLVFFSVFLSVLLFIQYIKRKIGGMTGDTIGAVSEFSEAITLLLCVLY